MNRRRPILFRLMMAGVVLSPIGAAIAQDADKLRPYKAAFVLNFVKFTQWPDSVFASEQSPIVVAVVGDDRLARELEKVISGAPSKEVHGRRVQVQALSHPRGDANEDEHKTFAEALRTAQVVFVDASERSRVRSILARLHGADVLTVGDSSGFAEKGGMLGLVLRQGKYGIEANPGEVNKTRVRMSSKLLELAKVVETRKE